MSEISTQEFGAPEKTNDENTEALKNSGETQSQQNQSSEEKVKTSNANMQAKSEEAQEESKEQVEYTDKGTRLAKDPLQRANQLRANAEAKVRMYEELLSNPEKLQAYFQELVKDTNYNVDNQQETAEVSQEEIDPEEIETVEDLRAYAKQLKDNFQNELSLIKNQVGSLAFERQFESLKNKIANEIKEVQNTYSVLRPTNPDGTPNPEYNQELDEAVARYYHQIDYDPTTGLYRGQYSVKDAADFILKIAGVGEKTGSEKTQTIIKQKSLGKAVASKATPTAEKPDETQLSASRTIAERIKRAYGRG